MKGNRGSLPRRFRVPLGSAAGTAVWGKALGPGPLSPGAVSPPTSGRGRGGTALRGAARRAPSRGKARSRVHPARAMRAGAGARSVCPAGGWGERAGPRAPCPGPPGPPPPEGTERPGQRCAARDPEGARGRGRSPRCVPAPSARGRRAQRPGPPRRETPPGPHPRAADRSREEEEAAPRGLPPPRPSRLLPAPPGRTRGLGTGTPGSARQRPGAAPRHALPLAASRGGCRLSWCWPQP